ncbi:LOW QUALITY PROTEIN: glycosyltransferase-like domain-containing protein 1 [Haliotis rubra]|uniref:LOW QUALITY PROTEIN: glycosyltransferase-like domain-containing protein 1 n=1 Tax=Haliotis rubra TaxID=36100 RepID=UPI001EE52E50|nr:LOW QUALITY PROTEIN: glycosyltransferase-like domain-containing protein 1 [Haliotis rubra]
MAALSEKYENGRNILIIEGFYGGSHKQLVDLLCDKLTGCVRYTLPAKKWHWRARTSALYFSQSVSVGSIGTVLFTSSVLNLAELTALRPDLGRLRKVVYFHENQLVYPVRKQQDRDFQYGYNQILSSLVADIVLFNSTYNRDSFLDNISSFLKLIPDHRPKGLAEQIRPKCQVLYFPLSFFTGCDKTQGTDATLMQVTSHSTDHQTDVSFLYSDHHIEENRPCGDLHRTWSKRGKLDPSPTGQGGCNVQNVKHSLANDSIEVGKPAQELRSDFQQNTHGKTGSDVRDAAEMLGDLEVLKGPEAGDGLCCVSQSSSSVRGQTTQMNRLCDTGDRSLHIVWAHRWEHDKDPETFFQTLFRLHDEGYQFQVSVMGETYTDVPEIFSEAKTKLGDHIVTWGYQGNKGDYYTTLQAADVAVSTARHEFFGVAMLEAVHNGCYPLCPDNLVYPEIFPAQCLYRTPTQLYKRLREYCQNPTYPEHRDHRLISTDFDGKR